MCSVQKTLAEHVPAKPPPPPGLCNGEVAPSHGRGGHER